jgi:small-conductance mechanosensitive channel
MDHKSTGFEYDREAFVPAAEQKAKGSPSLAGLLLAIVAIAVVGGLAFLGYKAVTQNEAAGPSGNSRAVAAMQQKISDMEERLDRLEQENHRLASAQSLSNSKKSAEPVAEAAPEKKAAPRAVYQVSAASSQPVQAPAQADPAAAQRIAGLQQGLGALKSDANANHEAWQATTDRLADVVGQVGAQHGEILKSQDQLDQLLARTEQKAVSFELDRSTTPQSVGPVSLVLKSINPKKQRYTLCVYVQQNCIELRDRSVFEVVRFVVGRNSVPLEVIATQVGKDGIVGYLEVPKGQAQVR